MFNYLSKMSVLVTFKDTNIVTSNKHLYKEFYDIYLCICNTS